MGAALAGNPALQTIWDNLPNSAKNRVTRGLDRVISRAFNATDTRIFIDYTVQGSCPKLESSTIEVTDKYITTVGTGTAGVTISGIGLSATNGIRLDTVAGQHYRIVNCTNGKRRSRWFKARLTLSITLVIATVTIKKDFTFVRTQVACTPCCPNVGGSKKKVVKKVTKKKKIVGKKRKQR
jgi:hypothetical protein